VSAHVKALCAAWLPHLSYQGLSSSDRYE
jgi:hypothetical protein